ncbi:MAG: universal stress protein [Acidimicrobiia bacterium]|nr:universal stress protein [Acidimicrobiia bacterium]MBT8250184.1 universal stress protein [Acidimicrobiia bacterium]NNC42937.1 universal stress protein [Acidimicrobiia bacterium]NNL28347.1 universal stress protein [Acidimicrobiia bacterium]NNL47388.1 universal stress protein [Acidimicrobiia bacterium]
MSIVVGIENAPHSEVALERAIQLAEALKMDLHVVHVKHIPAALYMSAPVPAVDFAQIEDEGASATWALVEGHLASTSATVTRETLSGNPADAMVEYASKIGADMIVVGSRGMSSFKSLILGSTSHRVLHLASCDVHIAKS